MIWDIEMFLLFKVLAKSFPFELILWPSEGTKKGEANFLKLAYF